MDTFAKLQEGFIDDLEKVSAARLKMLTPYLNKTKINQRQRKFAFFYALNGFNGVDACIKAGYSYNRNKKNGLTVVKIQVIQLLQNSIVRDAIGLILENTIDMDKIKLKKTILDMYIVQATYDPAMFYEADGTVKFKTLEEIPKDYRMCIVSMEKKYYGEKSVVVLKLVDRKWALEKLEKVAQLINDVAAPIVTINITPDEQTKLSDLFDRGRMKEIN